MIKIDKGIPIPVSKSKYPFNEMEIGDSFYTECKSIQPYASAAGKRRGMKFSVKAEDDGYRVWRTA